MPIIEVPFGESVAFSLDNDGHQSATEFDCIHIIQNYAYNVLQFAFNAHCSSSLNNVVARMRINVHVAMLEDRVTFATLNSDNPGENNLKDSFVPGKPLPRLLSEPAI